MPNHPHASRWILTWTASAVIVGIFFYRAHSVFGWLLPVIDYRGKCAIAGAMLVLLVKFAMSATRGSEYKPHEQGYDFSLMAAGAAVPGFAGAWVSHGNNLGIWGGAAIGALIALILSAAIAKAADDSAKRRGWGTWEPNLWTIVNLAFVGVPSFLGYIFLVVIKAQP